MGSMIIDGLALVVVGVLFVYLFGGFLWDERKRKKREKAQAEMFERKMSDLAADPEFDPDNFEISLRDRAEFPELCIDIEDVGSEEVVAMQDVTLRRVHNGFGYEWKGKGK